MEMEKIFTNIYEKNIWKKGSGAGSTPNYNIKYMAFLQNFIQMNNIKTVMDLGCGDWQFSRLIDYSDVQYTGIDCVKSIVDINNNSYAKPNINFKHMDIFNDELPTNQDLVILKDVLQHWDNPTIILFLDKLITSGHKYILIINNYKNCDGTNRTTRNKYKYSKLDANEYPLNIYKPEILFYYRYKQISIIRQNN